MKNVKKNSAYSEFLLGSYLYIDVQDAYKESTYAQENKIDAKNLKTELDKLPTMLKIKNCTFILSGVVEFISPVIDGGIGHYVAYCRRLTGSWIQRNDLLKRKRVFKNKLPSLF